MRKKPDRWGLVPGQNGSDLWRYKPIVIPYWEGGGGPRSVDYRRLAGTLNGDARWLISEPAGVRGIGQSSGNNNFVDFGNVVDTQFTNTTSFTIFSVFKPFAATGAFHALLAKDTAAGTRALFQWRHTAADKMELLFGITSSTLGSVVSDTTIIDGQTYAACVVRDVGADQLRIFMDGRLDKEVTDGSTGTWAITTGKLMNAFDTGGNRISWDGDKLIDIIFPFNALTNEEARQLTIDPYMMLRQAPLNVGRVPDAVAGAIMNQLQSGNVGADLYNGTIL